ncbi:hypothetical protein, partial [Sporisorium scitamineum]
QPPPQRIRQTSQTSQRPPQPFHHPQTPPTPLRSWQRRSHRRSCHPTRGAERLWRPPGFERGSSRGVV